MPHWLIPANWTPEWVSAIGGSAAAVFALVALLVTLSLASRQGQALEVTIKALNAELEARRREELAAREAQARQVEIEWLGTRTVNNDEAVFKKYFEDHNIHDPGPTFKGGVRVYNRSSSPIRDVMAGCEAGDGEDFYTRGDGPLINNDTEVVPLESESIIPPRGDGRFYWPSGDTVKGEGGVFVTFLDHAGVRWRLHGREGLSREI
jgi:hypothetical protein